VWGQGEASAGSTIGLAWWGQLGRGGSTPLLNDNRWKKVGKVVDS
jgi:hypothetical protein